MSDVEVKPAETFHPGEFMREEMEARGWSVETLAERSLLKRQFIEELLAAHRNVTPVIDYGLSRAFGTTRGFWMNLQASYRKCNP